MIKKKTIFVLGAGASIPYGYPSGADLIDETCDTNDTGCILDNNPLLVAQSQHLKFSSVLENNGVRDREVIMKFNKKLKFAYPPTLDYFLNQQGSSSGFVVLGKLRIANIILKCEKRYKNSLFLPREKTENEKTKMRESQKWYGFFFNNILRGNTLEDIFKNVITIINFNYDRSFECFVYNHLRNTYNASEYQVYEFFKHINYRHVYGVVAPIYTYDGKLYYDFDQNIEKEHVNKLKFVFSPEDESIYQYGSIDDQAFSFLSKEILQQIKLIDEERKQNGEAHIISDKIISESNRLCFLGFGYDLSNMDLLNLKRFAGGQVSGTVRDLAMQRIWEIRGYFKDKTEYYDMINDTNKNEYLRDQDIVSFLKYFSNFN